MVNNIHYWIWLAELLPPDRARAVCDALGSPERAFFSDPAVLDGLDFLSRDQIALLKRRNLRAAEDIVRRCERLDVRAVCCNDTEFPDRLRNMENPPLVLYALGKSLHLDNRAVIGMVGARAVSPYGRSLAASFGRSLVLGGGVVATGIVPGCDSIAAEAALAAGGPLVLVVPGGVDVPYQNSEQSLGLLTQTPGVGCILSEQPPGTGVNARRFHRRNELLIALSSAILCVEGGQNSGAVKIAQLAAELGRDVFVPPANLTSPHAVGSNALLSAQIARPAVHPSDLLSLYAPLLLPARQSGPGRMPADPRPTAPESAAAPARTAKAPAAREKRVDTVSNTGYIELLEQDRPWTDQERAILQVLREGVITVEALIARTGMDAAAVGSALVLLVVEQVVEELPGGRYQLHPNRRDSLRLS